MYGKKEKKTKIKGDKNTGTAEQRDNRDCMIAGNRSPTNHYSVAALVVSFDAAF